LFQETQSADNQTDTKQAQLSKYISFCLTQLSQVGIIKQPWLSMFEAMRASIADTLPAGHVFGNTHEDITTHL
jgi:hypothetical protein